MSKIERLYKDAYKHQASGNLEEAEPLYLRILECQPQHLEAIYLLGSLYAQQSRYAEALPLLERAVAINPNFTEALNNRGVALAALERDDEALASYAAAIKIHPEYADALNNQGILLQKVGLLPEAIDSFERAIKIRPEYAQALNNLGIALKTVERLEDAEIAFRRALAAQPDYAEAANNVGLIHFQHRQFEDALRLFDHAIAQQPEFPQAHNNRGATLKELARFDAAAAAYTRAMDLKPDYVGPYYNLGTCLASSGKLAEAHTWFDKAVALCPDDANAHWNRALGLLLAGNYQEGWPEYEWRFRSNSVSSHATTAPQWDGSPLNGRSILVHAEQGFGDTLNFLRYLPLIKQRGGRVLFECQFALKTLLADNPAIDLLLDQPPKGEDQAEPYDVQIPLLSLPGVFGTTVETIPASDTLLRAPADCAETWSTRLAEISRSIPAKLKVGIVWAGNPAHKNDHNRSCALSAFAPLANVTGAVFYGLQKGAATEPAAAPAGMTLVNLGSAIADFADTAAIMEHLDLVIAVDTSVVHLAGAMGKPVWMLTPYCPDWRWLMDRDDTPWYPSVRLFRQREPQNWDAVMARVCAELVRFAAQHGHADDADSLIARGESFFASGNSVNAMACFEQVLSIDANHAQALNNIAVLAYQAGGYDAAIGVLTVALKSAPNYADALANMGRCHAAKGDNAQAAQWHQRALRETPLDADLWNALGYACLGLNEAAARESFAQSLTLDGAQPKIRAILDGSPLLEPASNEPEAAVIGPDRFLRSFRRADLEEYCDACFQAGRMLAGTAYARRDSASLYANGVANADSRRAKAEEEWLKIAPRLLEFEALAQAGYEAVSRLPEFASQVLPALETFCQIGAEHHLLKGFLAGRAEIDRRENAATSSQRQPSLVSIVVPCYNYARFLSETVASVLAQTYANWEMIIVNDGSTDNSAEVAANLAATHPDRRIRVINQQNKRLAGARNSGIREALGAYILPLDADDLLLPTMLEECVAILDRNPHISFAYTDQSHFEENGSEHVAHSLDWDFAQEIYYNQVCVSSLFRREMWKNAGGYREDAAGMEDWDFWIACGKQGCQGWRVPQPLFRYRKHGASLSAHETDKQHYLRAGIVLAHRDLYRESEVRKARGIDAGYRWIVEQIKKTHGPHKMVSVIVATYNRPKMLSAAIESILAQTYQNFEIIVVNDAGEDVNHIVDALNAAGKIRLINKPINRGQADSRNVGIAAARGEYIAYLDDDDIYYPDHLETLAAFLENTGNTVAYTDALRAHQRLTADGGGYEVWLRDQPYGFDFDYDQILISNYIPIQCFMHAKTCIDDVGGFDTELTSHEDWEMWIRLSRRCDCIHLRKTTSEFSWREDGTSWTGTRKRDYARTTALIYRKNRALMQDDPRLLARCDAYLEKWEREELSITAEPPAGEAVAPTTRNWAVDVVMVVHNQPEYTRRAIESLYRNTQNFHLLLWDNGSDEPTRAYLEEVGRRENATLKRSEENLGFIAPNNRLAAMGDAPYIILLNSDTEVQARWDRSLMDFLTDNPAYGAVGFEGGLLRADALGCGRGAGDEIDYVAGWCCCLSRQTYAAHGLFDERNLQFAYGEDSDLSLRLMESGLRIHALSTGLAIHFGNKTIAEVAKKRDTRATFNANHEYLRHRWADYLKNERVLALHSDLRLAA